LSWCRISIGSSCACPGVGLGAGPDKWLRVMQKARQPAPLCGEQLTIVRVSWS